MNEETQVDQTETDHSTEETPVFEPVPAEKIAFHPDALRTMDTLADDHPDSPYFSQKDIDPSQRVWPPA